MEQKSCIKCNKILELFNFKKHPDTENLRNVCISCFKLKKAERNSKRNFMVSISHKVCHSCELSKQAAFFHKNKREPDGLANRCKPCRKVDLRNRYVQNKEIIIKRTTQYWLDNKEKIYSNRRKRNKVRRKTDPIYKLKRNLRNRLYYALMDRPWKKNTHFSKYIGCAMEELKAHIEKQFQPGMGWHNHTTHGWHLDHVVPLASAKTEQELYKLCHFTNLQPLWALDNIRKADKVS